MFPGRLLKTISACRQYHTEHVWKEAYRSDFGMINNNDRSLVVILWLFKESVQHINPTVVLQESAIALETHGTSFSVTTDFCYYLAVFPRTCLASAWRA